eukprot:CAMPEP_0173455014 /NCGR_PEP_ID=MMETSP1357-20121228/53475_1 /TAXON_ID=77926 /ORGANISM="Hemiselmis rufescens, Strain PCC563" /LENGTH=131 /DNA_ID=CAMNT_0014422101 /DNA_START=146 /DNA_END=537 /DNA_ORIENTATION=+
MAQVAPEPIVPPLEGQDPDARNSGMAGAEAEAEGTKGAEAEEGEAEEALLVVEKEGGAAGSMGGSCDEKVVEIVANRRGSQIRRHRSLMLKTAAHDVGKGYDDWLPSATIDELDQEFYLPKAMYRSAVFNA